jgi:hypothetical protein
MTWRGALKRFASTDDDREQADAVDWLRASVQTKTGPAFMPDDGHRCALILAYIDRLLASQPKEPYQMSEQDENELICEKLLGWRRNVAGWWCRPGEQINLEHTPAFATWADAGLILDALESRAPTERIDSPTCHSEAARRMYDLGRILMNGKLRPADVRAAALEYLRPSLET